MPLPDNTYNGWTNYETWVVNLWMGNDESTYRASAELARQHWKESAAPLERYDWETRDDIAARTLADYLKEEYETASADLLEQTHQTASVWADLLHAALSEVNWREIAAHLIDAAAAE